MNISLKFFAARFITTVLFISLMGLASTLISALPASAQGNVQDLDTELYALNEAPDDHVIGETTAPVIIETGKVRMVFREFPTAPGELAVVGFMIANCGGEAGYFDHIEYQMQNQKRILDAARAGEGEATYLGLAQKAGLADQAALQTCLRTQAEYDKISRSQIRARAGGVDRVPAFFINGERYRGNPSAAGMSAYIAQLSATPSPALAPSKPAPGSNFTPIPKN